MSLVKRGSRLITVDGVVYRWRVRKRPASARAVAATPLSFAVERAEGRGSVLIATMPDARPGEWVAAGSVPVVPSIVAAVIRQAIGQGWRADRPGPPFTFTASRGIWAETARI